MKRITMIILASVCVSAYASGNVAQRPDDGRLSPRLLNYQGYLTDTQGNPITNPSVSMTLSIYDAASAGSLKWTETQGTVGVDKGIFNVLLGGVTPIPDSVFKAGADRWLEIVVGGQTLTPRTRIVSVPYAYSATYSDTALYAAYSIPDFDWTYRVTDSADTTLQMGGRWGLTRPGNTLYGNRDSTHVNLGFTSTTGTNGQNYVYSTVGGGYLNNAGGQCATVGGGYNNTASGDWYATVGGGYNNTASNVWATVNGGQSNTASGPNATVGGGGNNLASNNCATVGGGSTNTASNICATVGGGQYNTAADSFNFIGGGYLNRTAGKYSAILGGYADTIASGGAYSYLFGINSNLTQDSTFMVDLPHVRFGTEANGYEFPCGRGTDGQVMVTNGAGQLSWGNNTDNDWTYLVSDGADTTLQMSGQWGLARPGNVLFGNADSTHVNFGVACTTGYTGNNFKYNTVAGGLYNSAANRSTVGGGQYNAARGEYATVGGGSYNVATGWTAIIAGGDHNTASNQYAFVGGGQSNTASGAFSTVGGGRYNKARGPYSVVSGGGGANLSDSNSAIGDYSAIGGGRCHVASGVTATVCGGSSNTASGNLAVVGGGFGNIASGGRAVVGGGFQNTTSGDDGTVGGGLWNVASGYTATISGGEGNTSSGFMSAVGGGWRNAVIDSFAFIGGGHNNHNAGNYSVIVGGCADTIAATGDYSYLFGINSNLTQDSTFMVDLPHVRFGKESGGYEFPVTDGTSGQALVTNGSGQVSWGTPSKHATYTPSSSSDPNGSVGDVAWDDSYVYIKTGTGWKRSAISTW